MRRVVSFPRALLLVTCLAGVVLISPSAATASWMDDYMSPKDGAVFFADQPPVLITDGVEAPPGYVAYCWNEVTGPGGFEMSSAEAVGWRGKPCTAVLSLPSPLAPGTYKWRYLYGDPARGLWPPNQWQWQSFTIVPREAPQLTIVGKPATFSKESSATFTIALSDPGAALTCTLDGSAAPCTTPQTYSGLGEGQHSFAISATDALRRVSKPLKYKWTVDVTAPTTEIRNGPKATTNSTKANFSMRSPSEKKVTFVCELDGNPSSSCKSLNNLAPGTHAFKAWAVDKAGNQDPIGDEWVWTIA